MSEAERLTLKKLRKAEFNKAYKLKKYEAMTD